MALIKLLVGRILANDPDALCYNCGERADERPENEVWTVYDGYPYCPGCAPFEEIY